jgi:hypothetical protein
MAQASEHPSTPDPVPTIDLAEAAAMLAPRLKNDAYEMAVYVDRLLRRGDVPLYADGIGAIHPRCFALGMLAVIEGYRGGKPIFEIIPRQALQGWVWGVTVCRLGRERFEAHLPPAEQVAQETMTTEEASAEEMSPKPLTPEQKVLIAIICRKHPNGFSTKPNFSRLAQWIEPQWAAACKKHGITTKKSPGRDMVRRTLRQASLFPLPS